MNLGIILIKKYIPKGEFSKNVLTLMTGTTIAQAIPVAISPILTRLYTPEDFGVAALYMAIATIIGSVATARYELAIMLPEKDDDALNIAALGLYIATILSVFLLILVITFNQAICNLLNNDEISFWLYFLPFSVFFIGLFNVLQYYNNRKKQYRDIAKANVYKAVTSAIVRLSVVFLKPGPTGLISGQITSQIAANTKLLLNTIKNKNLKSIISKDNIKLLAKRYVDFPKYATPAVLANTSSYQLTNILISSFYSVATLGYYSIVQRILGMPTTLIGNAIGQVFYQQASDEKIKTGKSLKTYKSTVKKLIFIGLPIFGTLIFFIEDIFVFVFGEEWRIAGKYAQILLPMFFIRFGKCPHQ
ncbi:MAG: oligosaccharide flippase family protein [Candidatus Marinimicrobia bacterium]|nr:oligosaccharide flippase family protein [Candidatus Neomarinimicrobiota bacterium]